MPPQNKQTVPDPWANITATPTDKLFEGVAGRGRTIVPDNIKALVRQSRENKTPLRVEVTGEDQAKALRKLLTKAGEQYGEPITVRSTVEKDGDGKVVAVRFQAGNKITRTAKPANAA